METKRELSRGIHICGNHRKPQFWYGVEVPDSPRSESGEGIRRLCFEPRNVWVHVPAWACHNFSHASSQRI